MALVSTGDSELRIYKPSFRCEYPSDEEESASRSRLLHQIRIFYREALKQLKVKLKRNMAARFLYGGGLCFGLLDPVSNIIANTLIPYKRSTRKEDRVDKREPVAVPKGMLKDLARRSLDGLVTFLIRFFPNLAESQAVRYLLLADADLLVASRIALCDIGMRRFGSSEDVVREALGMALKCAALAAGHPDPNRLVSVWSTLSSRHVHILTEIRSRSSTSRLRYLARQLGSQWSDGRFGDMWLPWHLAAARDPGPCHTPFQHTSFLKRTLQDVIHGFYLQALARLPAGELRSRFHRSLVKGGNCYGPLDPVSNIIINTIWYDAAFPPTRKLERDMIGNLSLHRMENCSLHGLASFLCTRYHRIDFHQAVRCLLRADANLTLADPHLETENAVQAAFGFVMGSHKLGCRAAGICSPLDQDRLDTQAQGPDTGIQEAFLAAATAAHHPNPDAQVKFLTSCRRMLGSAFLLLQGPNQLSSEDVKLLACLLCPDPPCEKPLLPFPLTDYPACELDRMHTRILKKVNAVLNEYAPPMEKGDSIYQLHVICAVNTEVAGPVYQEDVSSVPPHTYYHTHVNFIAISKYSDGAQVLFFAELSNDGKGESFCCPVSLPLPCAEQVRCLYCDYVGARIVHPVHKDFHGHKHEFEKMVCGKDPCDDDFDPALMEPYYTNMDMIENSREMAEMVTDGIKEDSLYDDSFVSCVNEMSKSLSCASSGDHDLSWIFLIPSSSFR